MQKTKQEIKKTDQVEETTSRSGKSEEAVEAAVCCLTEIDAILDEVQAEQDNEPLPSWHFDAEYDPNGSKPEKTGAVDALVWFDKHQDAGGATRAEFLDAVNDAYKERLAAWHNLRGLSQDRVRSRNSCVC